VDLIIELISGGNDHLDALPVDLMLWRLQANAKGGISERAINLLALEILEALFNLHSMNGKSEIHGKLLTIVAILRG
jgi:hypothetical protein